MLKMGLIGGGPGAMIGDVHRVTAEATGKIKLVGGCFSTDQKKNKIKGTDLGLEVDRISHTIDELIASELRRDESDRIDIIAIATPNHLHVPMALKCIETGFHVMCDKPLGITYKEGLALKELLESAEVKFGMTYTYRGYSAIQAISRIVSGGELGEIRKVMVDYSQGWLSELAESGENKQASWRTDPKYSGVGGTIADIGTHAFNMAEYVANLKVHRLAAQVSTLVRGRKIDDDANILTEYENGATGTITVGQALTGEDNSFRIQIYGDKGALTWDHHKPNEIIYKENGTVKSIMVSMSQQETDEMNAVLPEKHDPIFLKGFSDIYNRFADAILQDKDTSPNIEDGLRGMLFIERAIESSEKGGWVNLN